MKEIHRGDKFKEQKAMWMEARMRQGDKMKRVGID